MVPNSQNPAQAPNFFSPDQMQRLNRANQLLSNGKPGQAAALFAGLAAEMEGSGHPRRAANLHAQAAHAYADVHNGQQALAQARSALSLFIQNQMVQRTPVFYANITRKLTNKGMPLAAQALAQEFASRVGALPAPAPSTVRHPQLPTNCPKCGAPIHADGISWTDANTAECDYCGSLIRPV